MPNSKTQREQEFYLPKMVFSSPQNRAYIRLKTRTEMMFGLLNYREHNFDSSAASNEDDLDDEYRSILFYLNKHLFNLAYNLVGLIRLGYAQFFKSIF